MALKYCTWTQMSVIFFYIFFQILLWVEQAHYYHKCIYLFLILSSESEEGAGLVLGQGTYTFMHLVDLELRTLYWLKVCYIHCLYDHGMKDHCEIIIVFLVLFPNLCSCRASVTFLKHSLFKGLNNDTSRCTLFHTLSR